MSSLCEFVDFVRVPACRRDRQLTFELPLSYRDARASHRRTLHTYLVVLGGGEDLPHTVWSDRDPLTPPLLFILRSASNLRLRVDVFDGGRAILALAPSVNDDNALLRASIYWADRVPTHSVPVSGCSYQ